MSKITSKVEYKGNLRTEAVHIASGNTIITDAPVDNNGKGEAFSPTDTVATALASCGMTIMGIKAESSSIDISGLRAEVTKVMGTEPRRITKISVHYYFDKPLSDKEKTLLERAAKTCPVYHSLSESMEKELCFHWA